MGRNIMKKIIGGLLLSTLLAVPSFANAGPVAKPCPTCPAMPLVKWGGFKGGIQFGWGVGKNRVNVKSTNDTSGLVDFTANTHVGFNGPIGGFHAIYDFQFLKYWIVGLDTSIDFKHYKTHSRFKDSNGNLWLSEPKSKWTLAVMPRVGFALKDSLFYIGVGWATTVWHVQGTAFNNPIGFKKGLNGIRYAVGAAQRYNRILMGLEADYDVYEGAGRTHDTGTDKIKVNLKPQELSFKMRLSYLM